MIPYRMLVESSTVSPLSNLVLTWSAVNESYGRCTPKTSVVATFPVYEYLCTNSCLSLRKIRKRNAFLYSGIPTGAGRRTL